MYSALLGLGIGLIIFIWVLIVVCVVLFLIGLWKTFVKAGKDGWKSLIPIYNVWTLLEISGLKKWFFPIMIANIIVSLIRIDSLSYLASIASYAAMFFCNYNIAKKFGKDPIGYGIGLTLVPFIFYLIIGNNKDILFTDVKVSPYGPVNEKTETNQTNQANNTEKSDQNSDHSSPSSSQFCKNCGAPIGDEKFCTKCGTQLHL